MEPKPIEIITVPTTDLVVPDWNPRPFMDEVPLLELMAFMEKGGIVPRIWVWKGNGRAPWQVIAGQRRLVATRRLGRTQVLVEILDISLEDAKFLAVASNRDNKPYWLGEFIAVENLMAGNKDLKQVDIKAKLGWSKKRVSQAVNLMKLLNPASRQLIWDSARPKVTTGNFLGGENQDEPSSEDKWRLPEVVATRLIPLLDPLALEASQAQAEKALKMIVPRQLIGPQTDELVAYALSGKDLSGFKPSDKDRKPRTRKSSGSPSEPALPNRVPVSQPTLAAKPTLVPAPNTHPGLKGLFSVLVEWFQQSAAQSLKHTFQQALQHTLNRAFKAAIWFVILGVVWTIFHFSLTRNGWPPQIELPRIQTGLNRQDTKADGENKPLSGTLQAATNQVKPVNPVTDSASASAQPNSSQLAASAQGETANPKPGMATPQTELGSAPRDGDKNQKPAALTRTQRNARLALDFARNYYSPNSLDILPWIDYFKKALGEDNFQPFMDRHFPQEWMNRFEDSNLVMSFKPIQPVKRVESDQFSDWFLVKGIQTTREVKNGRGMLVSVIPVAAKIVMARQAGSLDKVAAVIELRPGGEDASADSADSPQASNNGDLITHAADAAADAAKKTLGF